MNERSIFMAALQWETATARLAYLDDALRRRVAALLTSLEQADGFLALAGTRQFVSECSSCQLTLRSGQRTSYANPRHSLSLRPQRMSPRSIRSWLLESSPHLGFISTGPKNLEKTLRIRSFCA
jgi:hypothetical protein